MLLDLDKWNPFRFLRKSPEDKGAGAKLNAPPSQQTAAPSTSDAAASAWPVSIDAARWPLPDPLHLLTDLIRDPFGGMGPLGNWFGDFSPSRFQPRLDVIDDGDALRIVAELPGLSREDVELEVIEDMLVLTGEKRIESKSDEKGCYRVERAFGQFQRAIPLPSGVDLERAEANFENGVLTVRLPKAANEPAAKRRLEIK
ncbi:heat shock protein Hsp20 [Caballeronia catudaia]|uniref:Heat shock protein Hsp20 n=1 Tax=Caballeronia catudaia TaxID=1777136 RepID=A0A158D202_9BURK|nr:Hsp20/alpha crystallin family protein [Caballeronia catudaia]SAK88523.1 heat shock protein Hsp20 [Caballeronia catudaia]